VIARRLGLAAALALLALAPAARAEGLALSASADRAEVPIGDRFVVTVRLENTGEEPVEAYELADARPIVSFDVQLGDGRTFVAEKIVPSATSPKKDWPRAELAPGAAWELEVSFPAVATGAFRITPHYGRPPRKPVSPPDQDWKKPDPLEPAPPHLVADPVEVALTPTEDGADALEVRFVTSMGPIRARLYPEDALGTVLNFVDLIEAGSSATPTDAELPRPRFYDGLSFHRVVAGFMVQSGCPKGDGTGDPGYTIPAEFAQPEEGAGIPEHLRHGPGRLSMARGGHPDTAGCQFFICVGTPSHLDGSYTCFGEVTRGLDVAYTMADVETDTAPNGEQSAPVEPIALESVRVYPVQR